MAAKRSEAQLRQTSAFIEALYEIGRYGTWAEFADEARVHRVSISEWKNANAGIDGVNLLRLIRAAAARKGTTAEDLATAIARASETAGDVGSIDQSLQDLSALVAEALDLLRRLASQQLPGEAPGSSEAAR